jgi:hypothetical protein
MYYQGIAYINRLNIRLLYTLGISIPICYGSTVNEISSERIALIVKVFGYYLIMEPNLDRLKYVTIDVTRIESKVQED